MFLHVPANWRVRAIRDMALALARNDFCPKRSPTRLHYRQAVGDFAHLCKAAHTLHTLYSHVFKYTKRSMALSHILRSHPFLHLDLHVRPPVLIPRPETEDWVSAVVSKYDLSGLSVLDIGCGSGCISLAIASAFPSCRVVGIDKCRSAIAVSRGNAKRLAIDNVTFIHKSVQAFITEHPSPAFDMLLSNPPYIPTGRRLPRSVKAFESRDALYSGEEGLDMIDLMAQNLPRLVRPTRPTPVPAMVCEIDSSQAGLVQQRYKARIGKDQFGVNRTAWIE